MLSTEITALGSFIIKQLLVIKKNSERKIFNRFITIQTKKTPRRNDLSSRGMQNRKLHHRNFIGKSESYSERSKYLKF